MKTQWQTLIGIAVLVLVAGWIGNWQGKRANSEEVPKALWLKTYALPSGYAPKIRDVINNTINVGKASSDGRAELLPDGRLAVYGTPFIQSGVESIINQLQADRDLLNRNVRFDFWVLFSGLKNPEQLPALPPRLAEVCKANGIENTRVYQRLSLSTCDGTWAKTESRFLELKTRFTFSGENLRTELDLNGPVRLETQLNLKAGQIQLLGQAGLRPKDFQLSDEEQFGQVIYLLEIQVVD